MHGVAAKHAHEVADLLQVPHGVLWSVVCQVALEVHIEEVSEPPPTHCTAIRQKRYSALKYMASMEERLLYST